MKNLLPKDLKQQLDKYLRLVKQHISFAAILAVLLAYIIVVWQISHLATADPDPSSQAAAATRIPKIDQKAINQIQSLEQSNTEVKALFNQARNNPFQE